MPNPNTFSIPPIRDFVMRHLRGVTVDPFAPRSGIWMNHQLWQILQQLRGWEIEEILMVPHGGRTTTQFAPPAGLLIQG